MKSFLSLSIVVLILSMTACESGGSSEGTLSSGGGGSTGGGGGGSSSSASSASSSLASSAMVLRVYVTPEAGTNPPEKTLVGECGIDADVDPLDDTPTGLAARFIDCEVKVPEQLLYLSTVTFEYGTGIPDVCTFSYFAPYFYRASNSAAFNPFWADTAVDCSSGTDNAACYNGAGKTLLGNFPFADGSIGDESGTDGFYSYEVSSGNSQKAGSNRWVCNRPRLDADRDITGFPAVDRTNFSGSLDGYVTTIAGGVTDVELPTTYQDYVFGCEDDFAEPLFGITLYLSDYDVLDINPLDDDDNDPGDFPDDTDANDYGDWDSTNNTIDPQP